ncbi:hypothetical protein ACSBOB_28440 [Mesorhizobium sp. ASY16-5R]|jgi:hypothetical protein|uniref:hypothetical protein n=1 Tax=Mesorhizobium sp. ASY16-5R TaxID=3445772 RepID=UPI003FA17946
MWIKLTKGDELPVLVNTTKINGASATKKRGSTLTFDEKYTAPGTRLTVGEPIEEVAALMGAASAKPARAQRR